VILSFTGESSKEETTQIKKNGKEKSKYPIKHPL
jgi:hypothetical protein